MEIIVAISYKVSIWAYFLATLVCDVISKEIISIIIKYTAHMPESKQFKTWHYARHSRCISMERNSTFFYMRLCYEVCQNIALENLEELLLKDA